MGTNITGIGNANAIGFKSRVTGGIYFPPELKDALVGVWSAYGKSNDSTDRNIIKNKIKDKGGDFVISNAAFKLNSGFGKYSADFESFDWAVDISQKQHNKATISLKGRLCNHAAIEVDEMKVNIIGNVTELIYWYIANPDDTTRSEIRLTSGINTLPKSYAKDDGQTYNIGFAYISGDSEITIEQIPSFEGAFVTDGINDLITSTKTVQEMLGGSNEITVVSLITHISGTGKYNIIGDGGIQVSDYSGQTFMAGTSSSGEKIVELGDKEKLQAVQYTTFDSKLTIGLEDSSYAYYGTFVFNKENVPVDWIHQVIAYFNLDRTLKPDILCDVKKQGITNENHAEFGDKLIDFSGNGRDIQLNNLAWDGDSGIGKYNYPNWKVTATIANTYSTIVNYPTVNGTYSINVNGVSELMQSIGLHLEIKYTTSTGIIYNDIKQDGVYSYILPDGATDLTLRFGGIPGIVNEPCNITITQIPSHAGALCLDGVNDFGKVTGMPVYKDYTFIIDYERISYASSERWVAGVVSKSHVANQGAFILMTANTTVEPGKQAYSFGGVTSFNRDDFTRALVYQSKYKCGDVDLTVGEGVDSNTLWLGTFRDNDQGFFNGAIYSLMSFPYSMSKFLIERQLKKYKLGTLYPDMVEFRPVINSNVLLDSKPTFVIRGTSTYLNAGDYVPENSQIWVSIKMNNIADRITKFTVNGKTIDIPENAYSEVTLQYGFPFVIDKSPQKIGITIEQDENYVLFNPVINSNYKYISLDFFLNNYQKKINIGDYIPKDAYLRANLYLNNNVDEPAEFTFNGVSIGYSRSITVDTAFNIGHIYNYDSPQEVNITIDEYIRYEDIVQPYPSFVKLENLDRTHTYTWGDKLRIGDTIRYNSSKNLLEGAYTLRGQLECNGVYVFDNNQQIVVTKEMVFAWSHSPVWTIGNSAPKCVFSPSKLRIPNSSYKYLGYIPDISGNGNHGVFNNFAFSKMSGADGYPYDYKSTSDFVAHAINAVLVNSETVKFINVLTQTSFYYKGTSYKGKIKVTGITKAIASGKVRYLDIYSNSPTNNDRVIIDKDGIYDVNIETEDAINIFFYLTPIVSGTTALDEPVYLEQVGNYEGSICFDGVDDYMDIPSLSIGGKQVLMKTNWLKSPTLLYDQRASGSFAILTTKEDDATNPRIAYQARNRDGKTYIDGIENNYIETYSLKGITHNITVTNPSAGSGVVPVIGANTGKSSSFAKMALYDFMLFDEVSTNEEIKQLNDIVGIEGNYVQRPPYYWDTHGKSNLDGDRGTIPQLGTAEDYSFTSFDNEIDWYLSSSNYIDVVSRNGYKITLKNLSTGIDGWRFQNSTVKRFILNDIPFKIKSNKTIRVYWDMHYNAISSTELRQKVVSVTTINPNEDTLINLRHLTEEELTELNVNKSTMYYLLWFDVSTLAVNEEVTIEMLPVEGGRNLWLNNYGFAYDKMSGYEGYSFKSFNDSQSWNIRGGSTGVEIISRNGYSMTVKKLVQNLDWQISNNEYRYPTILDKEVPFKCKSNKNVGLIWQLKYKTEGATSDTTVTLINQQLTPNVPLEISLPYKTQDELTELGAVSTSVYYLLYFSNTLLEIGEEYTVEMLPLYPNGLVYDGVDDYSENISIPAFTDYTYIFKRTLLNKKYNSASVFKGSNQQSGGGAFICDYNSVEPELMIQGYSFGAGLYANSLNTNDIVYGTKNSVNGQTITSGNNADTEGLTIGKWRAYKQMVFYKLMLYPRTTDMLTINMIKNMMAEDGIIDIQGKLFTDKFTGDFNLDFNKDFLIGN